MEGALELFDRTYDPYGVGAVPGRLLQTFNPYGVGTDRLNDDRLNDDRLNDSRLNDDSLNDDRLNDMWFVHKHFSS